MISWTKVSDKRSLHGPVPQRTLQLVLVYKRFGVIPIFVPTARLFVFLSTQFTAPTSPLFVHPPLENKLVLIALGLVVLCTKYSKLQGVTTRKRKNCRVFAEFRSPDHMISPSLCPLDTPTYFQYCERGRRKVPLRFCTMSTLYWLTLSISTKLAVPCQTSSNM